MIGTAIRASCQNLPDNESVYTNKIYTSPDIYQQLVAQNRSEPVYVSIGDNIFTIAGHPKLTSGFAASKIQRVFSRVDMVNEYNLTIFKPPKGFLLSEIKVELQPLTNLPRTLEINEQELEESFRQNHDFFVANVGQGFVFVYAGAPFQITVKECSLADFSSAPGPNEQGTPADRGIIHQYTSIVCEAASRANINIVSNRMKTVQMFHGSRINFEELGIGGLDKEFQLIFRRAFASRVFPPALVKQMGLQQVKGMLLYGPPGTGKTLIARQIGKTLNAAEPKIVNGPEVFNKFVGQTEENIRDLFKEAEAEQEAKGENSQLHIIIFDEFDAICKPRGMHSGGTGVQDTVVNQLLSKIDGVNSLGNILIIGMTNRKDMIDEAVLRPGRLEVHVEVGLPDEEGRQQIFRIHTAKMREHNRLGADVDLESMAQRCKNYTGAEIEAVVKSAASFSFEREIDINDLSKELNPDIKILMGDFNRALDDIKPMFGKDDSSLENCLRDGIIDYGDNFRQIMNTCREQIEQVREHTDSPLISILLHGPQGAGKTAIAASLAMESGFPFAKIITPELYVGYTENGKIQDMSKVFDNAYRTPLSIVVLDDIERLIEFVNIGPRFSNPILQAILVLVKKIPPDPTRRIVIVGTTSNVEYLDELHLTRAFNVKLEVDKLREPSDFAPVLEKFTNNSASIAEIAQSLRPTDIKRMMLAGKNAKRKSPEFNPNVFMNCLSAISH